MCIRDRYSSIIYLAVIAGIDSSIYEAAAIDGASRFQIIRRIMLPLLMPTVCILLLMDVGKMFYGDFGMVYALVKDVYKRQILLMCRKSFTRIIF